MKQAGHGLTRPNDPFNLYPTLAKLLHHPTNKQEPGTVGRLI